MAAITYDFTIEQGSYSTVTFVYQDVNGNNVDLTGWCVILQWKDDLNNTKVFSNREKNNTYDITTYSDGRIVFNLPAVTTNGYNFDKALYDIDLQEPNEQYFGSGYRTFRLATGTISILKRSNPQPLIMSCADTIVTGNTECPAECLINDIYAVKYNGNGLTVPDMSHVSDTISISDTRLIEKIEVVINGLKILFFCLIIIRFHFMFQDLTSYSLMMLHPEHIFILLKIIKDAEYMKKIR